MIVIRVELWSARTGKKTTLALATICNVGVSTHSRRMHDYLAKTFRGRSEATLAKAMLRGVPQRQTEIRDYPNMRMHVWNLVARALKQMGYDE